MLAAAYFIRMNAVLISLMFKCVSLELQNSGTDSKKPVLFSVLKTVSIGISIMLLYAGRNLFQVF